jgi:hypothetical protein
MNEFHYHRETKMEDAPEAPKTDATLENRVSQVEHRTEGGIVFVVVFGAILFALMLAVLFAGK